MIVCVCRAVSDRRILDLAGEGLSPEQVIARTGAGTGCGSCRPAVSRLVRLGMSRAEPECAGVDRHRDAA